MSYRILVVNPGSTSTKIGVYAVSYTHLRAHET